jgi:hypothetical protein
MNPRWTLAIAAILSLLAAAVILYWSGRREGAARERPKTEAAQAAAAVSGLETKGARETAQRAEVVVRRREAAARTLADVTVNALQSEDAHASLDPDRADRLRAADRELCRAAPELSGCAADRDPD